MQNPRFIEEDIRQLRLHFDKIQLIHGDRYCPLLGLRIEEVPLPETIKEGKVTILIPIPRCVGFFQTAAFSGIHVMEPLHFQYKTELIRVPFCEEIDSLAILSDQSSYYPLYERDLDYLLNTYFICLYNEVNPPLKATDLINQMWDYLQNCDTYVFRLAEKHKRIQMGIKEGDEKQSQKWITHLMRNVKGRLREDLCVKLKEKT